MKLIRLPATMKTLVTLALILTVISDGLGLAISTSTWQTASLIGWGIIAIVAYAFTFRRNIVGMLAALFATMVVARINGLARNANSLWIDVIAIFLMILAFLYLAMTDIRGGKDQILPESMRMNGAEWVVTYFRLYLGYTFIAHFTEKWFAGPAPHDGLVQFFGATLGLQNPDMMVWLAGACEFGAAISLVFGFLPRIGAVGTALYLFLSQLLGGHFPIGFIWALPGGGWEYGIQWMALVLAYAVYGAGKLSVSDYYHKLKLA